MQMLLF